MESKFRCKAGYFCDGTKAVSSNTGGTKCSIGMYCPKGTEQEVPCPIGTLGLKTGLGSEEKCTACPKGQFVHHRYNIIVEVFFQ